MSGLFVPATVNRTPASGAWCSPTIESLLVRPHNPFSRQDEPFEEFLFLNVGAGT